MTDFLERIGSFTSDIGAEIAAFDAATQTVFMVSGDTEVQLVSLADASIPTLLGVLDIADLLPNVEGVNSVAVSNGLVAIAIGADPQTDPGFVAVADIAAVAAGDTNAFQIVQVGALPDNVTFTPDGSKILSANEGEPDGGVDPDGSISIIDVSSGIANLSQANVATVGFEAFNGRENDLRADGVRIFPDAGAAQDFEPEFIAVAPDGSQAFVTLQENNALAVINLATNEVEGIVPLGVKDFNSGNGLDANDQDGAINIQNEPVFGLFMPDSIASFEANGQTFYITANEGDDRGDADEDDRGDAIRLGDLANVTSFGRSGLTLDESIDPALAEDENLGRLTISSIDGDIDGDGDIDQIFSYGARSFSIWDENGNQVFDSGSQIAEITAELTPELFNANDGDPAEFDNRSDNKGAEPEAVTTGEIGGVPFAFVGLERAGGGVLVYDLSDPTNPEFVQYARSDEDIAPEGLVFISAEDSPTGKPLLTVANEESNTLAVYETNVAAATISEIQGAGHVSPLDGELVQTEGIVTAVDFRGFYVQGADDGNDATSEGLFISTSGSPTVSVGDEVRLLGVVNEFIPGGAGTGNLSTTQMRDPDVVVLSSDNELPEAVVLGESGRLAPTETVISDDELPVNLQEEAGNFDPTEDAIDFYESLEGMRVTVEDAVAISPTRVFNPFSAEAFTLPNQGAGISPSDALTSRGGINLRSGPDNTGDQNPERVQIQFNPNTMPEGFDTLALNVGDRLGDVTGVVGYSFGNFEVNVTEAFDINSIGLEQEVSGIAGSNNKLTVASYNVLNLAADGTDVAQFGLLADQIVTNLNSPDIVALQEIQDDSGVTDDGTVDATQTLQTLVDAIATAGGPTYEFFDVAPENNTQGGVPGGNIRNAYLYNPERVELDSFAAINQDAAFDGTRNPLVANFTFNGNPVTVVNNHLTSRFGSSPVYGGPQPFVQAGEAEREAQAQVLNDFVDSIVDTNPDAKVIVLGDLNTFEFTNDLAEILPGTGDERVLTNLVDRADDDAYTFIFDGNSQVLDHLFVTDSLLEGAEFDIVHVNNDFTRDDNGALFTDTIAASDHEPILAKFTLEPTVTEPSTFTLQLLHAADQEAGIPALDDAPNFSAVLNALRDDFDNTVTLSSGDAILPGLFFSASEDVFGGQGRADILIQNELGFEAIALGNHEFDLGTELLSDLIAGGKDNPETPDVDESFVGAQFPYLSSNLDFSTDENLADLVVADDQAPQPNSLAATTVITVGGEQIGVVGATTPTLPTISSPDGVTVLPEDFDGTPTAAQLDALAAEIQQDVDEMLAANPGMNKVIVLSHMQQISIEEELATRLRNVDIIVAGGSNTRLADETDRLRDGDEAQGTYPIFTTDADGNPVAVVNTDGNYKYVGRLVVDFDENGIIIPESYDAEVSGAYATDDAGVAALGAEGLVDPEVQAIVDALEEVIVAKESNVFGISDVYLNGVRGSVRTEETNLGNLTADANLAIAKETDDSVVISLKNGGGIRDDIGRVVVPAGGTGEPELLPNEEIPGVKPEGGISETDIANTLRFNNGLTLLTITAEELLAVIEHGVSATEEGVTPGQFPQVSGLEFSFDPTATPNDRVQSLVVLDADGNDADVIVENGELVGDGSRTFRMVTLSFLAGGGDGYPFPERDVVELAQDDDAPRTGVATFAPDGSEQDALAEFLAANFGDETTPFDVADVAPEDDIRIQNLAFREDTVIDGGSTGGGNGGVEPDADVVGTGGNDTLAGGEGDQSISGGDGDDILRGDLNNRYPQGRSGGDDAIFGGAGNDRIGGKGGNDLLFGDEGDDMIWGDAGDDLLYGGLGNDTLTGDNFSGGKGSDTFAFAVGHGTDIITDFEVGTDVIGLLGALTFGAITQTVQGADLLLGTGSETLAVVQNVTTTLDETSFTQLIG